MNPKKTNKNVKTNVRVGEMGKFLRSQIRFHIL